MLLQVQPVDPRDMFRGDYVTLSYEFNRLPPNAIPGLSPNLKERAQNKGREIYVSLVPQADGLHFKAGRYSLTPPASGLFLRGTFNGSNQVEFGIENYYVQERTGHKYEDAIRNRRLWAEVAVVAEWPGVAQRAAHRVIPPFGPLRAHPEAPDYDRRMLSIVVPVFDEEESLETLYRQILEAGQSLGEPLEILFVDDGSSDGSWGVIRAWRTQTPWSRGFASAATSARPPP